MKNKLFVKNGQAQTFIPAFASIKDLLDHHALYFPLKRAVTFVDVDDKKTFSLSYAQLRNACFRTANFLHEKGARAGDRVAFFIPNSTDILLIEFAAALLGCSSVPLDFNRDMLQTKIFKLKDTRAKILFIRKTDKSAKEITVIKKAFSNLKIISLDKDFPLDQLTSGCPANLRFSPSGSTKDEYVVLYTSGSTANPKGVPLTLNAVMANAQGIITWQKLSQRDRFLIILPLHHINSTTMSFATILAGGTVVLSSRYTGSHFWEIASRHKTTITSVVPTILHDLLFRKKNSVTKKYRSFFKRFLIGSAPVMPQQAIEFIDTFGIDVCQGYGQTETALRATGVPVGIPRSSFRDLVLTNSIGTELAYCNVAILRENGMKAKEYEEGEICIRGPITADGYLNNREETGKAFRDGWFRSGDLGYYRLIKDTEYFFLKGRIKEIIIRGGTNISPAAIEDALLKSFPQIREVCVVGYPDSRMGEEIAAVINSSDAGKHRALKTLILQRGARGQIQGLSRHDSPKKVFIIGKELLKTSTGKIQRIKVKELVAELTRKKAEQEFSVRRIMPSQLSILKQAVSLNNSRWPVSITAEKLRAVAQNGYLLGAFDEKDGLCGTLSALKISSKKLRRIKTWNEATSNGTCKNYDPKGDVLLCISITTANNKKYPRLAAIPPQKLADTFVKEYLKTNLDNSVSFHKKPKGGMRRGARITRSGRKQGSTRKTTSRLKPKPWKSFQAKCLKSAAGPDNSAIFWRPAKISMFSQPMQVFRRSN